MKRYDYDLVVIGGGAAGLTAAKTANGFKKRVALVEYRKTGGECTHYGCVPSKSLINLSKKISDRNLLKFNDNFPNSSPLTTVREIIDEVYNTETPDILRAEGIDVYESFAKFIDPHTIQILDHKPSNNVDKNRAGAGLPVTTSVDEKIITAGQSVLCTGTSSLIPDIDGLDSIDYITNETIFYLEDLPKTMAVLGSGAVAMEIAQAVHQLGTDVTIINKRDYVLKNQDQDAANLLMKTMRDNGIKIILNTDIKNVSTIAENNNTEIKLSDGSSLTVEKLFIAVGRRPNIHGYGLEDIGVDTNHHGVVVNRYLQTSIKNIFAAGDVIDSFKFSHFAGFTAFLAVRNAIFPLNIVKSKLKEPLNLSAVHTTAKNTKQKSHTLHKMGWTIFTNPEIAQFGITEQQAKDMNIYHECHRADTANIDRGHTDRSTGFAKAITDKKGQILGATIVGNHASELIHIYSFASKFKIPLQKLYSMQYYYPTYSYLIRETARMKFFSRLYNNAVVKLFRGKR